MHRAVTMSASVAVAGKNTFTNRNGVVLALRRQIGPGVQSDSRAHGVRHITATLAAADAGQ
jgi:hypothetical protein